MNQTLGFDVRMPIFAHESFGNSVELQSRKVLSRLSHTPWASSCLEAGAISGVAIEQCATAHIHSLTDLDRLLKAILCCYEEQDHLEGPAETGALGEVEAAAGSAVAPACANGSSATSAQDCVVCGDNGCAGSVDAPTRRNSRCQRSSAQLDSEASKAAKGRRGLPWAVRDAFFHRPVRRGRAGAGAASGNDVAAWRGDGIDAPHHSLAFQQEEMDAHAPLGSYSGWETDEGLDVVVSPMSSARPSKASARATLTPHTSANAAQRDQDFADMAGGSSASTAIPVSPVEDTGRKTLPYTIHGNAAATTTADTDTATSSCSSSTTEDAAVSPLHSEHTATAARKTGDCASGGDSQKCTAAATNAEEGSSGAHARSGYAHRHHHCASPGHHPPHHSTRTAPGSPSFTRPGTAHGGRHTGHDIAPDELAGWLHLTVWTRCEIVSLLRELSGVQGYIAWSAWYWSYALKNPRYAMVHQALGSLHFWKRLVRDGFASCLANVHVVANQHMFQLKSAFQLLVSSIGALHSSLEQMNGRLEDIQRQSELQSSSLAAAAAVTGTRSVTAAPSFYSLEELPSAVRSPRAAVSSPLLQRSMVHHNSPQPARSPSGASAQSMNEGDEEPTLQRSMRAATEATGFTRAPAHTAYGGDSGADDNLGVSDSALLEELRITVMSTVSQVLALIRPQSVSTALAQSDEAFSENAALEQITSVADIRDHSSTHSSEESPRTQRPTPFTRGAHATENTSGGRRRVLASQAPQQHMMRAGSTYGFDRGASLPPGGGDEPFYFASTTVPRRFGEYQVAKSLTLREGVAALLYCVQSSQQLLRELMQLVVVENRPPSTRHWARVLTAISMVGPALYWLHSRSPEQIAATARKVSGTLKTLFTSYVAMPFAQIRDAIFYVRPGVEDRRRTLDRDAEALANIIRDYHENYYPTMPQSRLDEIRDHTSECFRAGVADEEGYGLIEKHYRDAVKHPIRSAFFGDLPRILLIQLSYQQLEVTRVVNGMDEVLEGNDLNFKIMAIMPVVGLVGLTTLWMLWRWRAQYKPMRMRMKQYWRAVSRVITFAEGNALPSGGNFAAIGGMGYEGGPFSPVLHGEVTPHTAPTFSAFDSSRVHGGAWQPAAPTLRERAMMHETQQMAAHWTHEPASDHDIEAWAATDASAGQGTRPSTRRPQAMPSLLPVAPAAMDEDATRTPGYTPVAVPLSSVKSLSNYEQGTVLLLTHLMRSTAIWYLRGYPYYYELMGDLEDLESAQCSRHQRLHTLQRMVTTHDFLK